MKFGLTLFIFPFLYLLTDLLVRLELIRLYSAWQLIFYGISVAASVLLFILGILFLNKVKHKPVLFNSFLVLFTFYLVVSIIGSYIFFYFNGFFPNYYTYAYFKNEHQSAFFLLIDTIKTLDIILFLAGFLLVLFLIRKLTLREIVWNSRSKILLGAICYFSIFSLLVVKIKKYDQCLLVDTNFSAAVYSQLINWDTDRKYDGEGLGPRLPVLLHQTNEKRNFNVIVVVLESMRKQNLQVYGYHRETTPKLKAFQKQHADEFFIFQHPYTVSTTTMLAVPAILTGIAPYQSPDIFYSQPIIWDYSKMLNYRNFFISSQSLNWYRFDRYYAKEKLDHFWYKEKSKHPFFNDLGIDDIHTIQHLNSMINKQYSEPFFGVVQLNSTHYPYTVPERFLKWKGTYLDDYDNAILYQDYVIGEMLKHLKKSGNIDNTVIIFTSDHGESLKDHNNIGHVDSYYAETISVPLMIYLPKSIGAKMDLKTLRSNLSKTTSNIDVAPTLIEILGLQNNHDVIEISKNFTGQSLFKPIQRNRALITINNNDVVHFKVGLSVVQDDLHYIFRTNIVPNREEVYNIKKDKKEVKNLILILRKSSLENLKNCFYRYPICIPYMKK